MSTCSVIYVFYYAKSVFCICDHSYRSGVSRNRIRAFIISGNQIYVTLIKLIGCKNEL